MSQPKVEGSSLYDMRGLLLAARTADAYSADLWGPVRWVEASVMLLEMGLTEAEAEGVLRSKHTRWARDSAPSEEYFLASLYHYVKLLSRGEIRHLAWPKSEGDAA